MCQKKVIQAKEHALIHFLAFLKQSVMPQSNNFVFEKLLNKVKIWTIFTVSDKPNFDFTCLV